MRENKLSEGLLTCWRDNPIFSPLDLHFAHFMVELSGNEAPELFLASALVSKFTREGHICLDLSFLEGNPLLAKEDGSESIHLPELSLWREILEACSVIGGLWVILIPLSLTTS